MSLTLAKAIKLAVLWREVEPIKKWKRFRQLKKEAKMVEQNAKPASQSLTIRALIVAAITAALHKIIGDTLDPSFTSDLLDWVVKGIELGSLAVAAYGRKRAKGPLV